MDRNGKFINPVESSLLTALVDLYSSDLAREQHLPEHSNCLACSKEDIIRAISQYRKRDALARVSLQLMPPEQAL